MRTEQPPKTGGCGPVIKYLRYCILYTLTIVAVEIPGPGLAPWTLNSIVACCSVASLVWNSFIRCVRSCHTRLFFIYTCVDNHRMLCCIVQVNGEDLREATHDRAIQVLRQTPSVVRMVVFRDESLLKEDEIYDVFTVELMKKPNKGLGLSIVGRRKDKGIFISDIVSRNSAVTVAIWP